jgi:hypothetical protein
MVKYIAMLCMMVYTAAAEPVYIDGILIKNDEKNLRARQFTVIDSFPASTSNYSMGLAFDGTYLWNDDAFLDWFATMDTSNGNVLNSFTPITGDRDMTFDGEYLWATDWSAQSINQYDTSDCSIIASYVPSLPGGSPHGMAWDGTHLWVGIEGGRIYQMTNVCDTVRSIPSPYNDDFEPRGLAFDGEYLWVGNQALNCIYRIDTISGTVLDTYSAPGAANGYQQGLTFDGQYLWSTCALHDWIYRIDIEFVSVEEHRSYQYTDALLQVSPNPFFGSTSIKWHISDDQIRTADGRFQLRIYDVSGRVVRHYDHAIGGLSGSITWFGTDNTDQYLPGGVYIVRFEAEGISITEKVLLIR